MTQAGGGVMRRLIILLVCLAWSASVSAQNADRAIEEIKTETLARAQTGAYPTLGIAPDDARDALALINTRDPDDWAAGWSKVADRYIEKAKAASGPRDADANYLKAWRLYYFGQWPAPTSMWWSAASGSATPPARCCAMTGSARWRWWRPSVR